MFLDASDPLLLPRRVDIEFRPTKRDLPKRRRDDQKVSRVTRVPRVPYDDFRGIFEHVSLLIDRSVELIVDHEKRPRANIASCRSKSSDRPSKRSLRRQYTIVRSA